MVKVTSFLLCAFLILIVKFAPAQSDRVKVKVFDGSTQPKTDPPPTKFNNKNYLNINPYLLGRGVFAVGYERMLHFKHSVFLDLGLTYRDFVYDLSKDDGTDKKMNVKTGSYFSAGYKFYPKGFQDFDGGFYISPSVIFRNYVMSQDIQYNNGSASVPANINSSYSMQEYALKFGYCRESWWFDDLITDVYFGVGSREITSNGYDNTNNILTLTKQTERKPALYLGVKIGFVF